MFNNKKAQAQIITVVLIILLVLAAIIIIWQVVQRTIVESAGEITTQSSCIGLNMIVVRADVSDGTVLVRREPGAFGAGNVQAVVFIKGEQAVLGTPDFLGELGTELIDVSTYVPAMAVGDEVQAAAKLSDGTSCALGPGTNAVA